MAKNDKQMDVIGWYQPHIAVNWEGMIPDPVTGELIKEPSMTKQSFKDECDINNIVKSFRTVQDVIDLTAKNAQGVFTDLPDGLDYQTALNIQIQGQQAFEALPAALRNRFANNPANFLDFMSDPSNQDEAIKLGLATDLRAADLTTPPPAPTPLSNSDSITTNDSSKK